METNGVDGRERVEIVVGEVWAVGGRCNGQGGKAWEERVRGEMKMIQERRDERGTGMLG